MPSVVCSKLSQVRPRPRQLGHSATKAKKRNHAAVDVPVLGRTDFHGKRLNFLQIGLGTFGTFVQNLTGSDDTYAGVNWLLQATSDSSVNLLAVGVEPVPEHVNKLAPHLEKLPKASLVQAAVGLQNRSIDVYTMTSESQFRYASMLKPESVETFQHVVGYLRNMSCVGQEHPLFEKMNGGLQKRCGVTVEMVPIAAKSITYRELSRRLRFEGVEVLMIDAEGCDCIILESMIDHCKRLKLDLLWPDVIQFETMGHCDCVLKKGAEADMCDRLESFGYYVFCRGMDTQLIKASALEREPRIGRWAESFICCRCGLKGLWGVPFEELLGEGILCRGCTLLDWYFGKFVWDWAQLPGDPHWNHITTDGVSLWGITRSGRCCRFLEGSWEEDACEASLKQLCVSISGEQVALDDGGRVLQRGPCGAGGACSPWEILPDSPILKSLSKSGDGSTMVGTDEEDNFHMWTGEVGQWQRMDGEMSQVAVSDDGQHIWGVNSCGGVYYREGKEGPWYPVSGTLCQVAVSGNGDHVWGVNFEGAIYHRAGYYGEWAWLPGQLKQVCPSRDSLTLWGITTWGCCWRSSES